MAAILVLSPIVWLHYLELLVVPLAITRPRLSGAWFLPLVLWSCPPGTSSEVSAAAIAVGLLTLAAVTVACEWPQAALLERMRSRRRVVVANVS